MFTGRARRKEYWMFFLINIIITLILNLIDGMVFGKQSMLLYGLYNLAILLPSLGVAVRRLHDTNRSGWFMLLGLIPVVGPIILLVFMVLPGTIGDNTYGADPKAE